MIEARVFHRDEILLVAAYGDLFVQCWMGHGSAAHVRTMVEAHRRFLAEHGASRTVALSHVATASTKPPDEETRAAMAEHTRVARDVRAVATVLEVDGFGAAMIRGVMSGLVMLSRRDLQHEVFASPREGLAFLHRRRDPSALPIALDTLVNAYARLRARS